MPLSSTLWQGGSTLVGSLKDYYLGNKADKPAITPQTALLNALLFTALYILPFYISPTLRATSLASRDDPTVIRARTRAVGLSSSLSTIITLYILHTYGQTTPSQTLHYLGLWPIDILDTARALLLVAILFAGPLYEALLVENSWREIPALPALDSDSLWISYRNYVIAPLSEEWIFRALTISLFLLAHTSPLRIIFLTPLIFGLAHIHHFIEFIHSRTPRGRSSPPFNILLAGAVRSLFQFTYTSLFGFFAAFVFLRTANFYAVVLVHAFCNYMAVPRFWGRVGVEEKGGFRHGLLDRAQGKREDGFGGLVGRRASGWAREWVPTVVYYALLVVGALAFAKLLGPLTASRHALTAF